MRGYEPWFGGTPARSYTDLILLVAPLVGKARYRNSKSLAPGMEIPNLPVAVIGLLQAAL